MQRRDLAKALVATATPLLPQQHVTSRSSVPSHYERTAAEFAVGIIPTRYEYPPLNVKRYGAMGDDVTDDRGAIKAAVEVARRAGGGVITFPSATYHLASYDPASPLQVPAIQRDLSIAGSPTPVQLYVQNADNIVFDFQGSTLRSSVTSGGALFVLDGCSNIRMLGPSFSGATLMTTGVTSLGHVYGGSGYRDGTYDNVPLTGGRGNGAHATIICEAGAVSRVAITYPGFGYSTGDSLSCAAENVGHSGSGFSVSVTSVTGQGNIPVRAGVNPLMILSLTRASSGIDISDLTVTNCYALIVVTGDPHSTLRARNISLVGNSRFFGPGEYGVCLHNNGDDVCIENAYVYKVNRPVFIYGVSNVSCNIVADSMNGGFESLIKAYSRPVRNITLRQRVVDSPGLTSARCVFQSQHNSSIQELPQTVENVSLDLDESNVGAGLGIEFGYVGGAGGATYIPTSLHPLFDNFVLRGRTNGALLAHVALQGAALCQINSDHLQFIRPSPSLELSSQRGYVRSRKFVYTPSLYFGEMAVPEATANADYYVEGGLCTVIGSISLSTKGGVGEAQILLPFAARADSLQVPLGIVVAEANMEALGGAIVGQVSPGSNRLRLFVQGPTGHRALLDANFTAHSVLRFQVSFPL